ncbi:hypothetical protein [Brevundimonas naejangsanensis]|uniref:hypothetical protein n=1 Tax=Brevundimonas naejangsanensis TaxID=588932 RepID=UPI0026E9AB53|nr:hypothetical protein [Brevundimonas naejangsanensis]
MSKAPTKTPPPIKPSRLRQRLLATTMLVPLVPRNDDLAIRLAFDAMGVSFR